MSNTNVTENVKLEKTKKMQRNMTIPQKCEQRAPKYANPENVKENVQIMINVQKNVKENVQILRDVQKHVKETMQILRNVQTM